MREEGATIWTAILGKLLAVLGGIILVILILSWLSCTGQRALTETSKARPVSSNGSFLLHKALLSKGELCGD